MINPLAGVQRLTRIRLGVGMLIIFTLIVMAYVSPLGELLNFENLMFWGEKLRACGWIKCLYFIVFAGAVMVFPITFFAVLGGILFPFVVALPFNLLATTVGSLFPFLLARVFGRKAAQNLCQTRVKSLGRLVNAGGLKTVLLVRWLGVPPFLMANYAFGLSAVRLRDYFWGTAMGIFPWMILLTYASHTLWHAAEVGGQRGFVAALGVTLGPLMIMSSLILASFLISTVVRRKKDRCRCSQFTLS